MPEFFLELFSEEIPARMQARAADDLKRLVTDGLKAQGLPTGAATAFATPRRLALIVEADLHRRIPLRMNHYCRLDPIRGRHAQYRCVDHRRRNTRFVRFGQDRSQQGRTVDNHRGSPSTSYSQS